jgi:UDP-N-acetyl-D-mannosaminuronate dehydrogenase
VEYSAATLQANDLAIILVDHPEFDPQFIAANAPLVFDTKALMRHEVFNGEVL